LLHVVIAEWTEAMREEHRRHSAGRLRGREPKLVFF
jgi:hypothetical protein